MESNEFLICLNRYLKDDNFKILTKWESISMPGEVGSKGNIFVPKTINFAKEEEHVLTTASKSIFDLMIQYNDAIKQKKNLCKQIYEFKHLISISGSAFRNLVNEYEEEMKKIEKLLHSIDTISNQSPYKIQVRHFNYKEKEIIIEVVRTKFPDIIDAMMKESGYMSQSINKIKENLINDIKEMGDCK